MKTGLPGFDAVIGHLGLGELHCITGRPCTGKTLLLLHIALGVHRRYETNVVFATAQEFPEQIIAMAPAAARSCLVELPSLQLMRGELEFPPGPWTLHLPGRRTGRRPDLAALSGARLERVAGSALRPAGVERLDRLRGTWLVHQARGRIGPVPSAPGAAGDPAVGGDARACEAVRPCVGCGDDLRGSHGLERRAGGRTPARGPAATAHRGHSVRGEYRSAAPAGVVPAAWRRARGGGWDRRTGCDGRGVVAARARIPAVRRSETDVSFPRTIAGQRLSNPPPEFAGRLRGRGRWPLARQGEPRRRALRGGCAGDA